MENLVKNEKKPVIPHWLELWRGFKGIAKDIQQKHPCVRITITHIEVFLNRERWVKNAELYGVYLQWNSLIKDPTKKDFVIVGGPLNICYYLGGLKNSFDKNGPVATCDNLYLQLYDLKDIRIDAKSFINYINGDLKNKSNDALTPSIDKSCPEYPTEEWLNANTRPLWLLDNKIRYAEEDIRTVKIVPNYTKAYKEQVLTGNQKIKSINKKGKLEKSMGR